jgi:aspartyl-tRNA(Asn)/glutamyl-tRNA(Gln) amidotransferase subunit B
LPGEDLGPKTEVKNMNSFSNVERALVYEIARQRDLRERGEPVVHQTLLWDAARGEARPMRSKEESHDYRYFPDPDLPVVEIAPAWLDEIATTVPEMPWLRADRLRRDMGLSAEHVEQLTASREIADYFERTLEAGADPAEAASWIMGEVLAAVNTRRTAISEFPLVPGRLAELLALLRSGQISRSIARQVFVTLLDDPRSPAEIVEAEGLVQVRDESALLGWVDQVIASSAEEVERFRAGDQKLMGFFVGQVMKLSRGKADPKEVSSLLRQKL